MAVETDSNLMDPSTLKNDNKCIANPPRSASFVEDPAIERFVEEVLQDSSLSAEQPIVECVADEIKVIDIRTSSTSDNNEDMEAIDGNAGDDEEYVQHVVGVMEDLGVFDVGIEGFVKSEQATGKNPFDILSMLGVEMPMTEDPEAAWDTLREVFLEVIEYLEEGEYGEQGGYEGVDDSTCSSFDEMMVVEDGQSDERLKRAEQFLLELKEKGPLQFAEDHELAETSACDFLKSIGFNLPRSVQQMDHKDQWGFIKRFLIKYVYQRPRNLDLYSFDHAVDVIERSKRILIVTGAGISVSCGIPDFRSEHGLYASIKEKFDLPEPECMFDIEFFRIDPSPFYMLAKVFKARTVH